MTEPDGNAYDFFVARHLREGRGARLAFADPWRSLTYAELDAAAGRFAAGLAAAGIERERRIALVMLDTIDFPIAFWGALRAGSCPSRSTRCCRPTLRATSCRTAARRRCSSRRRCWKG